MTTELKRKADRRKTCTITINLLELLGMVVTAWVMLELVGDRPTSDGDPISMRGNNMAAASWVNRSMRRNNRKTSMSTHENARPT